MKIPWSNAQMHGSGNCPPSACIDWYHRWNSIFRPAFAQPLPRQDRIPGVICPPLIFSSTTLVSLAGDLVPRCEGSTGGPGKADIVHGQGRSWQPGGETPRAEYQDAGSGIEVRGVYRSDGAGVEHGKPAAVVKVLHCMEGSLQSGGNEWGK